MKDTVLKRETLTLNGRKITVEWKNIKNMYLKVHGMTHAVTVSAPAGMPFGKIAAFVEAKENWLSKHIQTSVCDNADRQPAQYLSGQKLKLWGTDYTLQLHECEEKTLIKEDKLLKTIDMYVSPRSTAEMRAKAWRAGVENTQYENQMGNLQYYKEADLDCAGADTKAKGMSGRGCGT